MSKLILVSACLAGVNCRYDGQHSTIAAIAQLVKAGKALPVCPEVLGGLEIPRPCCEMVKDGKAFKVISKDGADVTAAFEKGAQKTLALAQLLEIDTVVLQSRSPSCGLGMVYDGTFSGRLVPGNGLTAGLLVKHGIRVIRDEEFETVMVD